MIKIKFLSSSRGEIAVVPAANRRLSAFAGETSLSLNFIMHGI